MTRVDLSCRQRSVTISSRVEAADEPWQFVAACDEYYCVINCDRHFTRLPIATGATCSGLQILAGMAKDKSTASL